MQTALMLFVRSVAVGAIAVLFVASASAQEQQKAAAKDVIPHAQDKPPGPALSPEEAVAKMTVPEGFTVEVVASEPNIVNPVAMTIDERGRFWITESLEYPRRSPGPGKDRVKILEDTDADGKADKFSVFMEGLNIPSGIAVGHGGVWVANAPDLLFVRDTDGDGKADTQEVVVTGFGRDDTHELPNSLTWGPDGWLYGLNGVFNPSHITYGPKNPNYKEGQRPWDFTCALFRIHPKTWEFQVFCEGTSNPWGVAFNNEGDAFVSACVIDHLWHLTETGYYHRQGGPYPPFTWKIESIVSHKHQKAAYCGIHWYDSDAYPEQYRRKLYMGNIHGSCINSDRIERFESTYKASPEPDFLSANDAWFMPVVQKTGPDGCLYILDWYDRYHCYQDANRDPAGIDRLKGRLYRIRYKETARAPKEDMSLLAIDELAERLSSPNGYQRDIAQRLLTERLLSSDSAADEVRRAVDAAFVFNDSDELALRCLGIIMSAPTIAESTYEAILKSPSPRLRAWAVRAAGEQDVISEAIAKRVFELRNDPSPVVRVQVAIAASKQKSIAAVPALVAVLAQAGNDPLAPRIVWQNLHPRLEGGTAEFVAEVERLPRPLPEAVVNLLPRAADRILSTSKPNTNAVASYVSLLVSSEATEEAANRCLRLLTDRIRNGEISGATLDSLNEKIGATLLRTMSQKQVRPTMEPAVELGASLGMPYAIERATQLAATAKEEATRLRFINALITAEVDNALALGLQVLDSSSNTAARREAIQAIGRIRSERATESLLQRVVDLPAEVQPTAVETLTDRVASSKALLNLVAEKKIPATVINSNQAQKMMSLRDAELAELVTRHWGVVRTERDPKRAELISRMRDELRTAKGDPVAGRGVFRKLCGQCHKIYGEGADVGPDITRNGRASFEQLLSNVFDPSLVIGAAYQGLTVVTKDGKAISGLPVEDSPQRIVLKVQGDKIETIARGDVEEALPSKLSLMPEGVEKQLTKQELHDLFAFISLDRPPEDKEAKFLAGARLSAGESSKPQDFAALVEQLLPGYSTQKCGEGGVAVTLDYHGRPALRTHPVSQNVPCVLTSKMSLPTGGKIKLRLVVASHEEGDWTLVVNVNGETMSQSVIGRSDAGKVEWREVSIDLSQFSGQAVTIDLLNKANGWSYEFGYWNAAEIVSEP